MRFCDGSRRAAKTSGRTRHQLRSRRGEVLPILAVHDKGCRPAPIQLTHLEFNLGRLLVRLIHGGEL